MTAAVERHLFDPHFPTPGQELGHLRPLPIAAPQGIKQYAVCQGEALPQLFHPFPHGGPDADHAVGRDVGAADPGASIAAKPLIACALRRYAGWKKYPHTLESARLGDAGPGGSSYFRLIQILQKDAAAPLGRPIKGHQTIQIRGGLQDKGRPSALLHQGRSSILQLLFAPDLLTFAGEIGSLTHQKIHPLWQLPQKRGKGLAPVPPEVPGVQQGLPAALHV